ncbi:4Fe-4S binding protein [Candidatus Micrarchaeota archaeon]|nr:4Fe-4S binding protein [Candidatus Micrarchaeota archaeon]
MPVFIDPRICDKQMICDLMKVCPMSAIYQDEKEGNVEIDSTKCNECLLCVKACPYLAVKLAKDTDELGELRVKAGRIKFNRDAHLSRIYGAKPSRIGKAELNDSNFQKKVSSKTPTLVSFWGAHSEVIAPSLKWIGRKYRGKLKVAHIKVAENPESRKKYAITTTPTLILFRSGKQIGRLEGVRHRETLRVWVEMKLKAR